MYTTYKMMLACTNKEYLNKDYRDLIIEYRGTTNARVKNKCVATIFCKIYPMILKIQKKFYTLSSTQKIEHVLYNLVIGIDNYDLNKKTSFVTFIHTHLTNKLHSLLVTEGCLKRKVFQSIVPHNEEAMKVYAQTKIDPSYDYDNGEKNLNNDINNSTFLSSEEKKYCSCLITGMTTAKEIGKAMKLVEKSKQSFAKPLFTNPLIVNDLTPDNDGISDASMDKKIIKKIKEIKDSIKRKYSEAEKVGINIFRE